MYQKAVEIMTSKGVCPLVFLAVLVLVSDSSQFVEAKEPFWRLINEWSNCSNSCGEGVELREAQCVKLTRTFEEVPLDNSECEESDKPSEERACNYGDCLSKYRWRTQPWSPCSQLCGLLGYMTRETECVYYGEEIQVIPDRDKMRFCQSRQMPIGRTSCNIKDCPPKFVPGEWDKCKQDDPCHAGRQERDVTCETTMLNNTIRTHPPVDCYMAKQKPPSKWRRCFITSLTTLCKTQIAEINENNITVVQMRRHNKIDLQVGQNAFVIPYTKVTVKCPVKFFSSQDIVWLHDEYGQVTYIGQSKERVKVDKQGSLHINNFKLADKGEWKCMAGEKVSTVTIKTRTPAQGFYDWARRNYLLNNYNGLMLNEDPKTAVTNQVLVQWVTGPWSECSVTCAGKGNQSREVKCEKVDTRVYHILEEKECENRMLPKPISKKYCTPALECPTWKLDDHDPNQCTSKCVKVGRGTIKSDLKCQIAGREVPYHECDPNLKPDIECNNEACQLQWSTSEWSRCSKSCGEWGSQARVIRCVWANTGEYAQSLCNEHGLVTPEVNKSCQPPPCNLDCIDFSPHCNKKLDLCRYTMYRYHCCKTCKANQSARMSPITLSSFTSTMAPESQLRSVNQEVEEEDEEEEKEEEQ